jgi:hypothetical protein
LAPCCSPDPELSHRFRRVLPCGTSSPLPIPISHARLHCLLR